MSFASTAHLTAILDGAQFARMVETGSSCVYALGFKRDGERVYAFWTARGQADAALTFDKDAPAEVSDVFGRTRKVATAEKALKLTISGEPQYVVTSATLASVALGKRAYPEDAVPPNVTPRVVNAMASPEAWTVSTKPDERLENRPAVGNTNYLPFRVLGRYAVRSTKDEEKGDCLEVELEQKGEVVPYLPEYAVMRLKTPAAVEGTPTTLGVWVKGNGGWGQLMWEFEDAQGERWLSCGTGGYGCDVYDWPKQASINFDGWNFVQFPITQASPVRLPNPGEVAEQWRSSGGGNGRIDYPVKLTGVVVSMTRQALNLTEMKPVRTVIRLKDLSDY
jgi:hypothetical protein